MGTLLSPKDTKWYRYAMKELTDMVGFEISGVVLVDGEDGETYLGLQLTSPIVDRNLLLLFLRDEEGNGAGYYSLDRIPREQASYIRTLTRVWVDETKDIETE